jgi:type IV pilus assembly protein PilY1
MTPCYRVTTDNSVNWDSKKGWYINLKVGSQSNRGERVVSDAVVRGSRVIFTTLLPAPDACSFGGDGWLMELAAATGGRPDQSPFDVNRDGTFTLGDTVVVTDPQGAKSEAAPSGRKSQVGIVPTPAIVARPGGGKEYKYLSGSRSSGGTNIEVVVESAEAAGTGRNSWLQLFRD